MLPLIPDIISLQDNKTAAHQRLVGQGSHQGDSFAENSGNQLVKPSPESQTRHQASPANPCLGSTSTLVGYSIHQQPSMQQ